MAITLFSFTDYPDTRLAGDCSRAIFRIVVHNEDLVQGFLSLKVLNDGSDRFFLVVGRDDQTDLECFVQGE